MSEKDKLQQRIEMKEMFTRLNELLNFKSIRVERNEL